MLYKHAFSLPLRFDRRGEDRFWRSVNNKAWSIHGHRTSIVLLEISGINMVVLKWNDNWIVFHWNTFPGLTTKFSASPEGQEDIQNRKILPFFSLSIYTLLQPLKGHQRRGVDSSDGTASDWKGVVWIAQMAQHLIEKPGAILRPVQVPGVTKDFSPRVNFQRRLSCRLRTAPVCNRLHQHLCAC